jgi:hypothetical protein
MMRAIPLSCLLIMALLQSGCDSKPAVTAAGPPPRDGGPPAAEVHHRMG